MTRQQACQQAAFELCMTLDPRGDDYPRYLVVMRKRYIGNHYVVMNDTGSLADVTADDTVLHIIDLDNPNFDALHEVK